VMLNGQCVRGGVSFRPSLRKVRPKARQPLWRLRSETPAQNPNPRTQVRTTSRSMALFNPLSLQATCVACKITMNQSTT
jgi:hypothetical protein